jgi:hypothetical protein
MGGDRRQLNWKAWRRAGQKRSNQRAARTAAVPLSAARFEALPFPPFRTQSLDYIRIATPKGLAFVTMI